MEKTPEQILNDQLATCLAAMQDCLAQARTPQPDDEYGHLRHAELDYVAKLVKAGARLAAALARLNGETRHNIHVSRDADKDRG